MNEPTKRRRICTATTCGNGGISRGIGITYLRDESRRVRIISFNPRVPEYEGENIPTARSRSAGSSAQRFRTGNWIPVAPRVPGELFRGRARETPFRGLSKNIDNTPRCKGDSPFTYGLCEGIGLRVVRSYGTRTTVSRVRSKTPGSDSQRRRYVNNAPFKEIVVAHGLCISLYLGTIA